MAYSSIWWAFLASKRQLAELVGLSTSLREHNALGLPARRTGLAPIHHAATGCRPAKPLGGQNTARTCAGNVESGKPVGDAGEPGGTHDDEVSEPKPSTELVVWSPYAVEASMISSGRSAAWVCCTTRSSSGTSSTSANWSSSCALRVTLSTTRCWPKPRH